MTDFPTFTLENAGGGAAAALFEHELLRVLENIADPNTDPLAVREITLKFRFKPDDQRNAGAVSISAKATLASIKPAVRRLYFVRRDGEAVAIDFDPTQGDLFNPQRTPGANVVPLNAAKTGETAGS
jgi:hypothetical protein